MTSKSSNFSIASLLDNATAATVSTDSCVSTVQWSDEDDKIESSSSDLSVSRTNISPPTPTNPLQTTTPFMSSSLNVSLQHQHSGSVSYPLHGGSAANNTEILAFLQFLHQHQQQQQHHNQSSVQNVSPACNFRGILSKNQTTVQQPQTSSSSQSVVTGNHGFHHNERREPKARRSRASFTASQVLELEKHFSRKRYLSGAERSHVSRMLRLSENQIKIWFQNKRYKTKKQEEDCQLVAAAAGSSQFLSQQLSYAIAAAANAASINKVSSP